MRLVAVGNPDGVRIGFLQQALATLGRPAAEVVPWLEFLREPQRLRDALSGDVVLRIESCGQDFAVERELIAQGAGADLGAAAQISASDARELSDDVGRVRYVAQRHAGYLRALGWISALLDELPCVRVMNPPAAIALMFDKRRCAQACREADVPVPPALEGVSGYDDLREKMRAAKLSRVFVKLAHASSASGVVALATQREKVAAHTTVDLQQAAGDEVRLYNTRAVRRYGDEASVRTIVDTLCREGVHVEAWIPKASLQRKSCDLRQVVIAGRAAHAVVRTSSTPLTNLHLLNPRGELSAFTDLIGPQRWAEVQQVCEAAHRAVGAPLYSGVDVCVARRTHTPYVLEVNAFGDLIPRIHDAQGRDTYAAELAAAFA